MHEYTSAISDCDQSPSWKQMGFAIYEKINEKTSYVLHDAESNCIETVCESTADSRIGWGGLLALVKKGGTENRIVNRVH